MPARRAQPSAMTTKPDFIRQDAISGTCKLGCLPRYYLDRALRHRTWVRELLVANTADN